MEGLNFKVDRTGLKNQAGGRLGCMYCPISKGNIQGLVACGELMELGKVLTNEGNACTRVNHGKQWDGRTIGKQGNRDLEWNRLG